MGALARPAQGKAPTVRGEKAPGHRVERKDAGRPQHDRERPGSGDIARPAGAFERASQRFHPACAHIARAAAEIMRVALRGAEIAGGDGAVDAVEARRAGAQPGADKPLEGRRRHDAGELGKPALVEDRRLRLRGGAARRVRAGATPVQRATAASSSAPSNGFET